eukprot:scaffold33657_cov12-Tisochrysis_lutea.AAC.1
MKRNAMTAPALACAMPRLLMLLLAGIVFSMLLFSYYCQAWDAVWCHAPIGLVAQEWLALKLEWALFCTS